MIHFLKKDYQPILFVFISINLIGCTNDTEIGCDKSTAIAELRKVSTSGENISDESLIALKPHMDVILKCVTMDDIPEYDEFMWYTLARGLLEIPDNLTLVKKHFGLIADEKLKFYWG